MAEIPERNLGLDLVRVTETAAMAAARWQGRGDKEAVDRAAVDAMRAHLSTLDLDGIVVIGEGEKDNAPMLFNGERVGSGAGPEVDVAVDPVDGTRLTAEGGPGALAALVVSERGTMYAPGRLVYMDKIAVGAEAAGTIALDAPVDYNLRQVAKARGKDVNDLQAIILDRPRNQRYIDAVREAGARIRLIRDGDVSGAIATAREESNVDVLFGIGGSPEAVLVAGAMICLGGEIQCRLWPTRRDRAGVGDRQRTRPPTGDDNRRTDQLEQRLLCRHRRDHRRVPRRRRVLRRRRHHPFGRDALQDRVGPLDRRPPQLPQTALDKRGHPRLTGRATQGSGRGWR